MSSKSSSSDSASSQPEFVTVGKVRKPHGVRGEVVVEILSDVENRFRTGAEVDLVVSGQPRQRLRIEAVRRTDGGAIIRFEGIESRDHAEATRGALLEVSRAEVPSAPAGSYYFFELIGCVCVDEKAGEVGKIERILEDGGGLVLEIKGASGILMVPFVQAYLRCLDLSARRLELNLPEGLIETCTSRF